MNRARFFTGGFLLRNDDFDFLQDAYGDAFRGIVEGLCKAYNGYLILSGCEITLVSSANGYEEYDVSEGYIIFNYEILKVPVQQSVTVPSGSPLEFILDISYASPRIYANQQVHDTHEIRKVIVQELSQVGIDTSLVNRLPVAVEKLLIDSKQTSNIQPTMQNGWTLSTPFVFKKQASVKTLTFQLMASQTFINAQGQSLNAFRELACTLPVAVAPETQMSVCVKFHGVTPNNGLKCVTTAIVDFLPNGDIYCIKTVPDQNYTKVEIHVSYL